MSPQEPEPSPYVFPDPSLTLRAALDLHRAQVPGLLGGDDPQTTALFAGHDVCHVLFGCSTRLIDEGRVDLWTMAATTMTVKRYSQYLNHPMVKKLFWSFPIWQIALSFLSFLDTPRILWRARHQTRPWDFDAWRDHLDRPLGQIRAELNIHPTHLPAARLAV